jgi:hypothetical protein
MVQGVDHHDRVFESPVDGIGLARIRDGLGHGIS